MTPPATTRPLGSRARFWAAALVLALCLWSSGAPSVLYPSYAAEWGLTPVVITTIFGTYPVALLLALLLVGGLSDMIGRRRAMLAGIILIVLSAAAFALASDVAMLYVGRALQGVGTALAIGAASAALVESSTSPNPRFAGSMTTASTATGLALSLLLSGGLAQYAPLPLVLSYTVLGVVGIAAAVLLIVLPDDRPTGAARWRPSALRIPTGLRRAFAASALSVSVAYAVGALFLSLGAQMARQLTGTTNLLVVGAVLAVSAVMIGVAAIAFQHIPAHISIIVGAAVSILGLGVLELTAATGSFVALLVWCVVGGVGYSLAFGGGLGVVNRAAPPAHRGGVLSAVYLVSYLAQAIVAVTAGALATAFGLDAAIDLVVPGVVILCLGSAGVAIADLRGRRSVGAAPASIG
ncbi:MFS transporter [Microbacteriaceae bacterium VKM Ac-2855]|nr:MFS transporter [Microbacteriaceae bacterium VKM Ac-2855]